jgi:hypothetical protein
MRSEKKPPGVDPTSKSAAALEGLDIASPRRYRARHAAASQADKAGNICPRRR